MRNLIIISGPSGSGKSTLIHKLLKTDRKLCFTISHTTRSPRRGEKDGRDYHFVTPAVFKKMIQNGQFAEWAEVHGQRYGTSRQEIDRKSAQSRTLVLDIDVQGARSIKRQFPEAMTIFIIPPTLAELKKRLCQREAGLKNETQQRLRNAQRELHEFAGYEYLIINRDLKKAFAELRCLLVAFQQRMSRNQDKITKLVRGRK